MEGARWDIGLGVIADAKLKELFPMMPVIYIKVKSGVFTIFTFRPVLQEVICNEVSLVELNSIGLMEITHYKYTCSLFLKI